MKSSKKSFPTILIVLVAAVVAAVWLMMPGIEHIEDANGPDDTSLATLTEADILADSIADTGFLSTHRGSIDLPGGWSIGSGVKISSDKLTGVTELLWADYLLPSDFYLNLSLFTVEEGNARLYVVNNDQIVAVLEPGEDVTCLLEDLTGRTAVRLVTESAAFTIVIPEIDYDSFEHD